MNNNQEKEISLKDRILKDIDAGNVSMRSQLHFTLKVALLAIVACAVVIVSAFIFNFILFSIHANRHEALLGFGPRGWGTFFRFFPWRLLFIDIALVICLELLIRKFRFGYKIPVIYLLVGLSTVTVVAGICLDTTPLNDNLRAGGGRGLPPLGLMYEQMRRPLPKGSGICRCEIVAIEGNVITVEDTRDATTTLKVILPMNDYHATTTNLSVGDIVFIAGEEDDGVIQAFGVRRDVPRPRRLVPQAQ